MATSKQAILEAARKLFSELGFKETTTAKIAKQAGVSEAAIYKYYKSKDALLDAVLSPIVEKYVFYLNQQKTDASPGLDCVMRLIAYHEEYVRQNMEDVRILLTCYPLVERLRTHVDDWLSILEDYLRVCVVSGVRDGSIRDGIDIDETIHFMQMVMFSMTRFALYWPTRNYRLESVQELCRRGLTSGNLTPNGV